MANTVASLNFAMEASTEKVTKALNRQKRQMKRHARVISSHFRSMARASAVAVAGLGFALASASRRASQAADDIAKSARSAQIGAENFQRMTIGLEQLGVEQGKAVKLFTQVSTVVREAGYNSLEYIRLLDDMGVSLAEVQGLAPDKIFRLFVDRLREIPDPAKRAALQVRVFGRAGAQMGSVLQEGSAGIDKVADRVQNLGGIIQAEALPFFEKWNDELTTFGRVIQAQFANGLFEAFGGVGLLDKAIKNAGAGVRTMTRNLGRLSTAISENRDELLGLVTVWASFKAVAIGHAAVAGVVTLARAFVGLAQALFLVVKQFIILTGLSTAALAGKRAGVVGLGGAVLAGLGLTVDQLLGGHGTDLLLDAARDLLGGILSKMAEGLGSLGGTVGGELDKYLSSFSTDPAAGAAAAGVPALPGVAAQAPQISQTQEKTAAQFAGDMQEQLATALARFEFDSLAGIFTGGLRDAFEQALSGQIGQFLQKQLGAFLEGVFGFILNAGKGGGPALSTGAPTSGPPAGLDMFSDFTFHDGGLVPGLRGQEVPAVLEAGELVIPAAMVGKGQPSQVFNFSPVIYGDFNRQVRRAIREEARGIVSDLNLANMEYT